jgi:hypothetical protein
MDFGAAIDHRHRGMHQADVFLGLKSFSSGLANLSQRAVLIFIVSFDN